MSDEYDDNVIGPVLPPGMMLNKEEMSSSSDDEFGPSLPPSKQSDGSATNEEHSSLHQHISSDFEIGPTLPPHLQNCVSKSPVESEQKIDNAEDISSDDDFGPALPPNLKEKQKSVQSDRVLGPSLPPGYIDISNVEQSYDNTNESGGDNDAEAMIGPVLPSGEAHVLTAAEEFEKRATKMKNKLLGLDTEEIEPQRETWMMELPPEMTKNFGMGPRKFRANAPEIGDRSGWTETPEDRTRKTKEGKDPKKRPHEELSVRVANERDKAISKQLEHYDHENRGDTLMELHKKKTKKEKIDEDPQTRRPFSREVDLQTNSFDDAQRKAIVKKSQELNTRFGHGSTKYI